MSRIIDRLPRIRCGRLSYGIWRGVDGDEQQLEQCDGENLIVTNGEYAVVQALGGAANRVITQFGVGSNATAPAIGNMALTAAVLVAIGAVTYPSATSVAFAWNVARGVATGLSISEFGLLTADNTLVARKTRSAPIVKAADIRIAGTWTLHF